MKTRELVNFSTDSDERGVFRIVLDMPGRPLNVLDQDVITELEAIVSELEQRDDIRVVVFQSGKESGFLAGADVEAIHRIRSSQQADRLLKRGQRLFDRIEQLPVVSLAILHGPCLGGGLELALACDYRIARDNSSTKIGLPEIKLGLIPGWGGTQRLPRRVGLTNGLSMILSGKHLSAREALQIGLIDCAIPPDQWSGELVRVVDRLSSGRGLARSGTMLKTMLKTSVRLAERMGVVRRIVLSGVRKRIAKQSQHYPALNAAVHAVADGYRKGVDGFETERNEFKTLVQTRTCRQLLRLFLSRERARNRKTWAPAAGRVIHREPIRKLGVIGAGAMGAGIAQCAATRGYKVGIKEVDEEAVGRGTIALHQSISKYARHKAMTADQEDELLGRITIGATFDGFDDVDCVIEAVVEKIGVKKAVLAETESVVGKASILATNTSALSVTEMARDLERPSQFAGLHFFNPVHRMELVEVVRGKQTDDETIARLVSFVRALGKTPIVTSDSPGFLVNRILFPYLGEAVMMVREGHDVASIDREIRRFGMPVGPLELLDRVGLDVALHVAETLRSIMGDVNEVIKVLEPLVKREETGLKSGRGFYDHRGKQRRPREASQCVDFLVAPPSHIDFVEDGLTEIQRRLLYPMMAESIRCQEESVVEFPWAIDLGMVLGTGFAPHRGGPLSLIDQIGRNTVVSNLEQLRSQLGERFAPPLSLLTGAEQ